MSNKPCEHVISINLEFMKRIFALSKGDALTYSTLYTKINILNHMSKNDLKSLANWIITSGVITEKTEKTIDKTVSTTKDKK